MACNVAVNVCVYKRTTCRDSFTPTTQRGFGVCKNTPVCWTLISESRPFTFFFFVGKRTGIALLFTGNSLILQGEGVGVHFTPRERKCLYPLNIQAVCRGEGQWQKYAFVCAEAEKSGCALLTT